MAQIEVPDLKAMVYMYTVEEELPVTAGNEISKVKWMPADTLLDCGTFVIQRAMRGGGCLILSGLVSDDIVFAFPCPCDVA